MLERIIRSALAGCCIVLVGCGNQDKANSSAAAKGGAKIIRVATEASFPPMEFMDDKGHMVGFDVDLISAVALKADLGVDLRNVAWDGIFGALKAGEADVIISSVTI